MQSSNPSADQPAHETRYKTESPTPFLRIGTRGSPLALVQARDVQQKLAKIHRIQIDQLPITIINTDGDRTQSENLSLKDIGGKGLFSKEIEAALLANQIDIGVHSAKDMATTLPDGLIMPTYLQRQDVRDAFISPHAKSLDQLPKGAIFGTSSLRRAAQIRHARPDIQIVEFRGNIDTRLNKLDQKIADATLLAAAGLNRLDKSDLAACLLDPLTFPTAPAQGAVGIECRINDPDTRQKIAPLNHAETHISVSAERAILATIDGSCRTPIGVWSQIEGDTLSVRAEILSLDGSEKYSAKGQANLENNIQLGASIGHELLDEAGEAFFENLRAG